MNAKEEKSTGRRTLEKGQKDAEVKKLKRPTITLGEIL